MNQQQYHCKDKEKDKEVEYLVMNIHDDMIFETGYIVLNKDMEVISEDESNNVTMTGKFDLQLFARAEDEGRTEEPTPRKRQRARELGQVVKSMELTYAAITLITCCALALIGYYMVRKMFSYSIYCFSHLHEIEKTPDNILTTFPVIIWSFFKIVLPIMIIAVVVAIIIEACQVGIYFAPRALRMDFSRMRFNVSKIWQKLIPSKLAFFEYGKTFFKVIVVSYISYKVIKGEYITLLQLLDMGIVEGVLFIATLTFKIVLYVSLFLLIMSLFDYLHQRHEYKQSLMMTRHELRDEWKQLEGDPLIRGRIKQRQREVAARRMMVEVEKADVVITNPVHIAVAIKYDSAYMTAPMVVAKGKGLIADRIVQIARDNDVPVIENKPLAEALFETVDIGAEVTPDLYQAVAEVLAFVYRLREGAGVGV